MPNLLCRLRAHDKLASLLLIPLAVAVVGAALLFAVSLIPNSLLSGNAYTSAYQLLEEDRADSFYSPAGRRAYDPDTFTDALIVQSSFNLTSPSAVLLNRVARLDAGRPADSFVRIVSGEDVAYQSYSRYWMGFRIFVRPLLVLVPYYSLRAVFAACYALLAALACAVTARRNSIAAALALAASCLLVEPYAVSASLQFSCVFLLMFVFVSVVGLGRFALGDKAAFALFCLFGSLTQFFDFYTYPLISCLFPLILLIDRSERPSLSSVLLLLFAWLGGYLLTWLLKLCFVTLFTAENGFQDALASVLFRFGVGEYRSDALSYRPSDALAAVWRQVTGLIPAQSIFAVLILLFCLLALRFCAAARGRTPSAASALSLRKSLLDLFLALFPLCWFAVAAQPTIIHVWFQYRLICASCFAVFMALCSAAGLSGRVR